MSAGPRKKNRAAPPPGPGRGGAAPAPPRAPPGGGKARRGGGGGEGGGGGAVGGGADMAYEGQRHNIRVSLPAELSREAISAAFAEAYRSEYKQTLAGLPVRLTTLRVTVLGVRPRLAIGSWVAAGAALT